MLILKETRPNGSKRLSLKTTDESKVEQSHKDTCDINSMVARARRGAFTPPKSRGSYGDFTSITSYQDARNRILACEATFFTLPAEVRKRFENNPQAVLDFLEDPANKDEAIKLGLIERPKEEKPGEPAPVDPVEPSGE